MRHQQTVFIFSILIISFLVYSIYLYTHLPFNSDSVDEKVLQGKKLWQEKNCNACHQIYGLGGFLGPDLTNVYSQKSPEYIKVFIQYGTVVMPKFSLSQQELSSLLAFLKSVDETGNANPKNIIIHSNGTITTP